jgi:hypothetical protein
MVKFYVFLCRLVFVFVYKHIIFFLIHYVSCACIVCRVLCRRYLLHGVTSSLVAKWVTCSWSLGLLPDDLSWNSDKYRLHHFLLIKFSCFSAIPVFFFFCLQCFHSANILIFRAWMFARVLCFICLVIVVWSGFPFFPRACSSFRTRMLYIQAFTPLSHYFALIFVTVPFLCSCNAAPTPYFPLILQLSKFLQKYSCFIARWHETLFMTTTVNGLRPLMEQCCRRNVANRLHPLVFAER